MLPAKSFQLYQAVVTAAADVEGALNRAPTAEHVIQMDGDILANMTDAVYALRESYELIDSLRKSVKRQHEELQRAACALYSQLDPVQQSQLNDTGRVEGEFATGKPSTKTNVTMVKRKKDPELYDRFCREALGVTNTELIESGAIEAHFVHFSDWVTKQVAEGKVLPDVINKMKTYNELGFGVIKKKAILS